MYTLAVLLTVRVLVHSERCRKDEAIITVRTTGPGLTTTESGERWSSGSYVGLMLGGPGINSPIKLSLFQTQTLSEWMGRGGVPAARDNQKALLGNQSQGPNCPVGDYKYFGTQDTNLEKGAVLFYR